MKILDVPQSGSVGGVTSSRNRYGQYRRTRAIPVQPRTPAQVAVRANLTSLAQLWQSLSGEARAAWGAWALLHPRTDSLGQSNCMSGFQAYVSVNARLLQLDNTTNPVPPDPVTFPGTPITGVEATTQSIILAGERPSPTWRLLAYAAPPQSCGVQFVSDYRFVKSFSTTPTGDMDLFPEYFAKWGAPGLGLRVHIRIFTEFAGLIGEKLDISDRVDT
jgi:hypothetical protein